jgi:hypothetical protein
LGAFGDSGFWDALKGFDVAWDIEQHGHSMIYGCTGSSIDRYSLYKAATGLLVHKSVNDTYGGCIDSPSWFFPFYSANLGYASGDYFCAHSNVVPAPPADVTGPLGNAHCGLYERTFANGAVFANLSGPSEGSGGGGTTYTVTFAKPMKNADTGAVATSFQVAPKRGLILQNT